MIILRARVVNMSQFWSVKSGENRFMNLSSNNVMQKLRNSCFFVIRLICRPHVARFSKISTNHFWLLHHQISAIRHFNHFQLSKKFKFKMIKSPITHDERILKSVFRNLMFWLSKTVIFSTVEIDVKTIWCIYRMKI